MADISIITSLYKSEKFLARYAQDVKRVAREVKTARLELEVVAVANDASPVERRLLEQLQQELIAERSASLRCLYVPRETLYASWNRGIAAAQSDVIGPWNVDDVRTAEGLLAMHDALSAGAQIADCAFVMQAGRQQRYPPQFKPGCFSPKCGVGPFFMFQRSLYAANGPFSPHFTITGDFEWSLRPAAQQALYQSVEVGGGTFVLHGENLSGSTNARLQVEFNTALIWHGAYEHLLPVDPDAMRRAWQAWGHIGGAIPVELAEWLWGAGARVRYERYQWERNLPQAVRRIFLALAKRGLVHSVDWQVHQP